MVGAVLHIGAVVVAIGKANQVADKAVGYLHLFLYPIQWSADPESLVEGLYIAPEFQAGFGFDSALQVGEPLADVIQCQSTGTYAVLRGEDVTGAEVGLAEDVLPHVTALFKIVTIHIGREQQRHLGGERSKVIQIDVQCCGQTIL